MRTIALLVVVLALLLATPAPNARAAAQTWTVIAGGSTKDFSVVSNAYHPRALDIAVGDTVTWLNEGFHNITFLGGQAYPPLDVKEGDTVLYAKYAGTEFKVDGEELLIVSQKDILAIVNS